MPAAVLEITPELGPPRTSFDHHGLQASAAAASRSACQVDCTRFGTRFGRLSLAPETAVGAGRVEVDPRGIGAQLRS
jgi:hypothetical protein